MILIATELYYPERTSTGRYLTEIAEGLANSERVVVLCSQPTYSRRGLRAPAREIRNGVDICRVRSTTFDSKYIALRLINALTFAITVFVRALTATSREDRVLVVTNPPVLPFVMALACRIRGAKLHILIHDVYPDLLEVTGHIRAGGPTSRLMTRATRWLYSKASSVIVLGRDMARLIRSRCEIEPIVIPHWPDPDVRPAPRSPNPLLADLGIDHHFVLQYAGNMGRTHDLDLLLDAARELERSASARLGAPFHLLIIGSGARRRGVEERIVRESLTNVTVVDPLPWDQIQTVLAACDVSVLAFLPGMDGVSVPSRLYNVLASGRPIIGVTGRDSELAYVIEEKRVGWVVEPENLEQLLDAIEQAGAAGAELGNMSERAQKAASETYNVNLSLEAYRRTLAK